MKQTYYLMLHWGANKRTVTGFVVPQAESKEAAVKQLKDSLLYHIKTNTSSRFGEYSEERCKEFLHSLKKPWKLNENGDPYVRAVVIDKPLGTNYWMFDIEAGESVINVEMNK